ncbi:hypothetical protein ACIPLR_15690 [Herbaspirillum huttiense]|uniref:hypothetical protein n=1 Tax=Herbaspirillum huttiense TaxID=863372 RepID=UPI00381D859E
MALTPDQEEVKTESERSQEDLVALDRQNRSQLVALYDRAIGEMRGRIMAIAGARNSIQTEALAVLIQQLDNELQKLAQARNKILDDGIAAAADLGARPFGQRIGASAVFSARSAAIERVRTFQDPSGLRLSDRIWRLDRRADDILRTQVQAAVARGDGAAKAALEFVQRGVPVPPELDMAARAARPEQVAEGLASSLSSGPGNPLDNTMRVLRTEVNRAHTVAYQGAAAADLDTIGTKFMLSPRHPRVDICDMHARANLFGLGPGVYPHGRSPLPAHPNTLSFEVVVYRDEVTDEDRKGKQTVVDFLKTVASKDRQGILGVNKNEAFEAGDLPASQVRSTWRAVKKRLERQQEK